MYFRHHIEIYTKEPIYSNLVNTDLFLNGRKNRSLILLRFNLKNGHTVNVCPNFPKTLVHLFGFVRIIPNIKRH